MESDGIKVSMDGLGRVYDNIFIERLWRSAKYERVYLHYDATIVEANAHLAVYFLFYSEEWLHETLGHRTPHEVCFGTSASLVPVEAVVLPGPNRDRRSCVEW